METITLERVYYIAELFGLVAVIGSLIFVGLQVMQNTRAVKVSTMHNVSEEWRDMLARLGENTDVINIMWNGLQDPESISGVEKYRFDIMLQSFFFMIANTYYQYQAGVYDSQSFLPIRNYLYYISDLPGVKSWWKERGQMFAVDFQQYYENEIVPKAPPEGFKLASA